MIAGRPVKAVRAGRDARPADRVMVDVALGCRSFPGKELSGIDQRSDFEPVQRNDQAV